MLFVCFGLFLFSNNNESFYSKDIVRIENIEVEKIDSLTNGLGFVEEYSLQRIEGVYLNGKNKGEEIKLENEITDSSVVTETYRVGDKVFVEHGQISGLKRDNYLVILISIFILSIYLVGNFQGLLSIFTVLVNSFLFYFALIFFTDGFPLIPLCLLEIIFFTVFSLGVTNKFKKYTISAIVSTICSVLILLIFTGIVFYFYKDSINFMGMSFLTVPPEEVFFIELLLGGFGAIMDVCITISTSFFEMIQKNSKITNRELISSGREIGKDVMGTMINVLFFTYLSSGLPVFVLALRNGFTLFNYIHTNYSLEIIRFLVGAIGIVLAIPVSIFFSLKILRREKHD